MEKHTQFCEDADTEERQRDFERKCKEDRQAREEAGFKKLEEQFQARLNVAASSGHSEYKKELVRVKKSQEAKRRYKK